MAYVSRVQKDKRRKLLNRFYEPLVLLYVLDQTQGDHLPRPTSERFALDELTLQELRRRLLESLAYLCDFEQGGDTTTAVFVASAPLTYYISSNRTPKQRVESFLGSIFLRLASIYGRDPQQRRDLEDELLHYCTDASERRLRTYWKDLQASLEQCRSNLTDEFMISKLSKLEQRLAEASSQQYDLCRLCDSLMKSSDMTFIKEKVVAIENHGNRRSPFAEVRHFVGRLAFHARCVRVLMSAATRYPVMFHEPLIEIIEGPPSIIPSPGLSNKVNIESIPNRMIRDNEALLTDIRVRLRDLNQNFEIERIVRAEYANKNFKPYIHAELILLEHIYQNRQNINLVENDNFIGISKPSCYCCFLYIRQHPGRFVEPATHQKIYLNWMPPTSIPGVQEADSDLAHHERIMLNKMVESIRARTIDQIMSQTGRRQKHFDSVTGETFPALIHPDSRMTRNSNVPQGSTDGQLDEREDPTEEINTTLARRLKSSWRVVGYETGSAEDSDAGGVSLS